MPDDEEQNGKVGRRQHDDDDTEDEPHASDSAVQRTAEAEVLVKASQHFRCNLAPATLRTPSGLPMEVDGVAEDRSVLVEVYVRYSALKSGNKRKIMTDVLRLTWLRDHTEPRPRVAICLTSREAAKTLVWDAEKQRWPGWADEMLHDLDVEVLVHLLDDPDPVIEAERRQER